MKKIAALFSILAFTFSTLSIADTDTSQVTKKMVEPIKVGITTNMGYIELALNEEKAPITVANFLSYIKSDFYVGTIFHRVIPGFMIQGGGFTPDMKRKATQAAIKNEANNGLKNNRGTIVMARTSQVDSATSQFFINVKDNAFLNNGVRDFGYAVFGDVITGMDVVDNIANVKTAAGDVPVKPIEILEVKVITNSNDKKVGSGNK